MLKPFIGNIDNYISREYGDKYNFQKLGYDYMDSTLSLYPNRTHSSINISLFQDYIIECEYNFEFIQGTYKFCEKTGIPTVNKSCCIYFCKELKIILQIWDQHAEVNMNEFALYFDNSYFFDSSYKSRLDSFFKEIDKFIYKKSDSPKINIVTQDANGFKLYERPIEDVNISIEDNYNEDFEPIYKNILNKLNISKSKGLILLHGNPGTGKTTLIRHICSKIKTKKIIYIPSEMAKVMADPAFLTFLIQHTNSIIVVEDAEELLQSRDASRRTSAVSNILNMSDGLLSDVLNIQIICTFNCPLSNIDEALLRKGRIIAKYEFRELSLEKTQALLPSANSPMTLADIYNNEDQNFKVPKRNAVGFGLKAIV